MWRPISRLLAKVSIGCLAALALVGCNVAVEQGNIAYDQGQYDLAAQYWLPEARAGDPDAAFNLALLWERGLGSTPKNETMAARWYSVAVQQEHVRAMLALAALFQRAGRGPEALTLIERAARWDDDNAKQMLRSMGRNVPEPDLYMDMIKERRESYEKFKRGSYSMHQCPDGTYVYGDDCHQAPDGTYVGNTPRVAPDGTYVGGRPTKAPDGTYVGKRFEDSEIIECPDGSYVSGTKCKRAPDGTYVGVD